jgi:hypothetical protein
MQELNLGSHIFCRLLTRFRTSLKQFQLGRLGHCDFAWSFFHRRLYLLRSWCRWCCSVVVCWGTVCTVSFSFLATFAFLRTFWSLGVSSVIVDTGGARLPQNRCLVRVATLALFFSRLFATFRHASNGVLLSECDVFTCFLDKLDESTHELQFLVEVLGSSLEKLFRLYFGLKLEYLR